MIDPDGQDNADSLPTVKVTIATPGYSAIVEAPVSLDAAKAAALSALREARRIGSRRRRPARTVCVTTVCNNNMVTGKYGCRDPRADITENHNQYRKQHTLDSSRE